MDAYGKNIGAVRCGLHPTFVNPELLILGNIGWWCSKKLGLHMHDRRGSQESAHTDMPVSVFSE